MRVTVIAIFPLYRIVKYFLPVLCIVFVYHYSFSPWNTIMYLSSYGRLLVFLRCTVEVPLPGLFVTFMIR